MPPPSFPRFRHPYYLAPVPGRKGTRRPSVPADCPESSTASTRASYLAATGQCCGRGTVTAGHAHSRPERQPIVTPASTPAPGFSAGDNLAAVHCRKAHPQPQRWPLKRRTSTLVGMELPRNHCLTDAPASQHPLSTQWPTIHWLSAALHHQPV